MQDSTRSVLMVTAPGRRLRAATLAYGLLVFIWLTPEDNTVWPVALLGVGLAFLCVMWLVRRHLGGSAVSARYVLAGCALLGGMVGLGGTLATAGLMFFKNALHAHVFWDFPPGLVGAMLSRAPSWALAGVFIGTAVGCLWMWHQIRGVKR